MQYLAISMVLAVYAYLIYRHIQLKKLQKLAAKVIMARTGMDFSLILKHLKTKTNKQLENIIKGNP